MAGGENDGLRDGAVLSRKELDGWMGWECLQLSFELGDGGWSLSR
jgi:hypothetical protein